MYYHLLASQYAINDLERKMIRVSTLDTLNDPFELMPYLRYGEKEKIRRYMEVRKQISVLYGLLCFSRTWEEPLLWSNYADKHKGIAIGFEINRPNIFNVKYDSNPIRKQFDLTNDTKTNKNLFLELAKIKYINWQYEKESRILIKLNDCTKINGHFFIEFKNNLIVKEVRLGAKYNYNATNVEYIFKLLLAMYPGAEIIPCRLQRQGYKINYDGHRANKLQKMFEEIT